MSRVISARVVFDVIHEAERAHELHGIDSMLSPDSTDGKRLAILMEEVGEVATECIMLPSGPNLETELAQVAAMAMTWLEAIRRDKESKQETRPYFLGVSGAAVMDYPTGPGI